MEKPDLEKACCFATFEDNDLSEQLLRTAAWFATREKDIILINLTVEEDTEQTEALMRWLVRIVYLERQ